MPTQRFGWGQEAHPEVREGSEGPPEVSACPPEVREESGGPPEGPAGDGRPTLISERPNQRSG